MATLTGKTIASTYTSLLKLEGDTGSTVAGASGNAVQVKTGDDEDTTLYLNTDRIGIGAADPGTLLEVRGPTGTGATGAGVLTLSTAETTIRLTSSDQLGRIDFQAPKEGGGTDAILVGASIGAIVEEDFSSSNNSTGLFFSTGTTSAPIERMRIDQDGNVGIGTAAPATLLEVRGPDGNDQFDCAGVLTLSTAEAGVGAGDHLGRIQFQAPSETGTDALLPAAAIWFEASSDFTATSNAGLLCFATAASETVLHDDQRRMVIDSLGKVGIGTAAPYDSLEIKNAAAASILLHDPDATSDSRIAMLSSQGESFYIKSVNDTNSGAGNGGTMMTFDMDTGYVGIGSATPTSRLQLAGNISASAWGVTGIAFDSKAATYTDTSTSASATVATAVVNSFAAPTLASTNAITVTDAWTIYVPKPVAGSNTTITRANSAYFEGNVGIGTATPGAKFTVLTADNSGYAAHFHNNNNGTGYYGIAIAAGLNTLGTDNDARWIQFQDGNGTDVAVVEYKHSGVTAEFTTSSDERLKENIADTQINGLDNINALKLRQFNWAENSNRGNNLIKLGLVAQEVPSSKDVYDIVSEMGEFKCKDGTKISDAKGIGWSGLIPYLVKAIQELSAKVEALENA